MNKISLQTMKRMDMQENMIDIRENIKIREMKLARLLMDQYNLKILSSTTGKALSVRDMAFMYFIPLASCYRKVKELEEAGLLKCEGEQLSRDGKQYKVYKCQVSEFNVSYRNRAVVISMVLDWEEPIRVSIDMNTGRVQKDTYERQS